MASAFAPLWAQAPDDARAKAVCARSASLAPLVRAVADLSPPADKDAAAWSDATDELQSAWKELAMACSDPIAAAQVNDALTATRTYFDKLQT